MLSSQTYTSPFDVAIVERFQRAPQWGLSTTIDLFDCEPEWIRSVDKIGAFAVDLCDFIQMKRYGEAHIFRFGNTPDICGVTLLQMIETSSIVAHFIDATNDGCIDLFSCAAYGPYSAAEFCKTYFGARSVQVTFAFRGRKKP